MTIIATIRHRGYLIEIKEAVIIDAFDNTTEEPEILDSLTLWYTELHDRKVE